MAGKEQVKQFLESFKAKLSVWGVFFRDDRGKNMQTLLDLEITPLYREMVLNNLLPEDYSAGPKPEKLYDGADMWVFGKQVKSHEVYIKITMGAMGAKTICISFHTAEHKMNYPFKQQQ